MYKRSLVIIAAFLLVSMPALAGIQTGQVTKISARANDGLVYFQMSGTAAGKPSCATLSYWMIKDENSNTGKRQLAMLLTARATGQEITVDGFNTCTRWGDGEDVNDIRF